MTHLFLAYTKCIKGDYEGAIDVLLRHQQPKSGDDAFYMYLMGYAKMGQQRWGEALHWLSRSACELYSNFSNDTKNMQVIDVISSIMGMMARCRRVMGDLKEALELYDMAISACPTHPKNLLGRSVVRSQRGDPIGAMHDMRVAQQNASSEAHHNNAIFLLMLRSVVPPEISSQPSQQSQGCTYKEAGSLLHLRRLLLLSNRR